MSWQYWHIHQRHKQIMQSVFQLHARLLQVTCPIAKYKHCLSSWQWSQFPLRMYKSIISPTYHLFFSFLKAFSITVTNFVDLTYHFYRKHRNNIDQILSDYFKNLNISNSVKLQVSRSNIIYGSCFAIVLIIMYLSMDHVLGQIAGIWGSSRQPQNHREQMKLQGWLHISFCTCRLFLFYVRSHSRVWRSSSL